MKSKDVALAMNGGQIKSNTFSIKEVYRSTLNQYQNTCRGTQIFTGRTFLIQGYYKRVLRPISGIMSEISRRLTVSELSQRIVEMAKTGVYRESIFETFQPVATKQQIRHAIRHAKQFGLHSIATMRDTELGTYYQLDQVKFDSLKSSFHASLPLSHEDVVQRMTEALITIRLMLTIAGTSAIALLGIGLFCWVTGRPNMGLGLVIGAISTIGIWGLQRAIANKLIP